MNLKFMTIRQQIYLFLPKLTDKCKLHDRKNIVFQINTQMTSIAAEEARQKMNNLAKENIPFLFVIDFEMQEAFVEAIGNVNSNEIRYDINGITNFEKTNAEFKHVDFESYPFSKEKYCEAFKKVQKEIFYGNSFLLNLTFPSKIETNYTLEDFFRFSKARYKIWVKDRFVSFSPEIFVQTKGNKIFSYPMKGTIDASIPNADQKLLSNKKETAEHYTIVDLIRNDLSIVAKDVDVLRFRYLDTIKTHKNTLLQMSSEINGTLRKEFLDNPGDLMFNLLPAGSVSGAPKKKTLEIIRDTEGIKRGFYTGVAGIYNNGSLDSGVLIRYIEKNNDDLFYRSGGGITGKSNCEEEYQELTQKIYVPFH